ncbi:MAG: HNH endonuclease [Lachnospiraceae bacterium]|nr:HNH endonuclease [Lachnospiraceae bacterium]
MKKAWPQGLEAFVREQYREHTVRQLVPIVKERFGLDMTVSGLKSYISNRKITGGRKGKKMPEKRITTPEIDDFISKNYKGTGYQAMADMVNEKFGTAYTASQINGYYARNKLNSGLTGRFEKGHIPSNKGKHIETKGRMAETQFKKGNIPKNHRPVGSTRVVKSGKTGIPYIMEKVAEPNKWRMKHVVEWEKHNGPVPKGMIVVFGDGNPMNTDVSNLVLISKGQNAVMNRWNVKGYDKETTETAANIARLKMQIAKARKARKK